MIGNDIVFLLHTALHKSRPRKKRPQKLSKFSTTATPAREQKCRVNELENIAKNAMQILQEHGITAQTSPYPLAITDIHGQMRQAKKSEFVNVIKKYFPNAFSTHCPLLDHPTNTLSVIHDLLYYIHMPPGFGVDTVQDYFSSLWDRTVASYYQCQYVYIIIDKPNFLPPPRTLVHQARSQKAKSSEPEPNITDKTSIPHGNKYTSLLSVKSFEANLMKYLTNK